MAKIFYFRAVNGDKDQIDSTTIQYEDDDEIPPPFEQMLDAEELMQAHMGYLWSEETQPITILMDGPFDIRS